MPTITYENREYDLRADESVLKGLLRQGREITFSCGKGSCTVCMHRCTNGSIPVEAQRDLKPELKEKGYFLPCICIPSESMTVEPPRPEDLCFGAHVISKEQLSPSVIRLILEPEIDFVYRAGQFINIIHDSGLARSYSLASVYGEEPYVELHIQIVPGGMMSEYIQNDVSIDDVLNLSGPFGDNFYRAAEPARDLVLIGTGTGLAPVYGIAKNALYVGHEGQVFLFHAGTTRADLYLHQTLLQLDDENEMFHYRPYTEQKTDGVGSISGKSKLSEVVFYGDIGLYDTRIHVAGQPDTIDQTFALAREHDFDPDMIIADAFESSNSRRLNTSNAGQQNEKRKVTCEFGPRRFDPDPEMWKALDDGKKLKRILQDFYTRAFDDQLLSPYFHNVSKQRLIEKVYSYLRQAFTGERYYFGNHPKNAHHWMVIDDDIFDYRERLLLSCIRRQRLPEHLVQRWRSLEEQFRADIVKDEPQGRIIDGKELPVSGFGEEILGFGSLCDGCSAEIAAGEKVRYHLRLGTIYGSCCNDDLSVMKAV